MPYIDVSHFIYHLRVFLWVFAMEINMKHWSHVLIVVYCSVHSNLSIFSEIVLDKFVKTLMKRTVRKLIIYQIIWV